MNDEEKQAKADELAEGLKRANEEFIRDTPGVHPIGKVRELGERYGHPFHDRVADYIEQQNGRLQASFMEGFNSAAQDKAISYLRGMGIITANTPPERVNEFLVSWKIAPLPTTRSTLAAGGFEGEVLDDAVRIAEHESGGPVDVGEAKYVEREAQKARDFAQNYGHGSGPLVGPSADDEIVDAEIVEDDA